MKRRLVMLAICFILSSPGKIYAQANEIAQLALNVEKLRQMKEILTGLKKSYEILSKGYSTVKDLSQGNFSLHKTFLDGLMEVSPAVKKYRKVGEIAGFQLQLLKEYKEAYRRFKEEGRFNADELEYLGEVYENLLRLSLRNLDEMITIITAGKLRMSDAERLEAIDRIHSEMEDKLQFLHYFNNSTLVLSLQRGLEQREIKSLRQWHEGEIAY